VDFAQRHAISDVCVLVEDLDRSVAFYVEKLGFRPLHRAPGFADFSGAGLTLALWQIDHIAGHTGISAARAPGVHKLVIAVKLPSAADIDECFAELTAKGVAFAAPPADYPWNARCCYFAGPDGEVWELYGWHAGGGIGKVG
jgi:catechol 2,3-dioxygenase-like lactoylglutathione lyase family enzyme